MKIKRRDRTCNKCHQPYRRRNLAELWMTSVNGAGTAIHIKLRLRICLKCQTEHANARMLNVLNARFLKSTHAVRMLSK